MENAKDKDIGRRALLYTSQELRMKAEDAFMCGDLPLAIRLNRELDNVFEALCCYTDVYALYAVK